MVSAAVFMLRSVKKLVSVGQNESEIQGLENCGPSFLLGAILFPRREEGETDEICFFWNQGI
jgi:hypothetical protein